MAKLLNLKTGDDPKNAIGKKIHIGDHDKLYSINDSKVITGHYLKDKETLANEGKDLRAINNYCIQYANEYYNGNIPGQLDAQKKINSLFKEEIETKTIKAYVKLQNSTQLKQMVENNETINTITRKVTIRTKPVFSDKLTTLRIKIGSDYYRILSRDIRDTDMATIMIVELINE